MSRSTNVVTIGAIGSIAIIVGASAYKKKFPSAKQVISTTVIWIGVATIADVKPNIAAPAAGIAFASIGLAQGLDFASALGKVQSYKGATKTASASAAAPGRGSGAPSGTAPAPVTPGASPLAPAGTLPIQRNIVAVAETWLGVPYRWGGNGKTGVDCSGLTKAVYGANGITLPRVSSAQYHSFKKYGDTNPPPAAEVFFNWGLEIPPGHCGISIGGGQFIHAPHTGDVVKVSNLAEYIASGAKWYGYTLPYEKG